MKKNIDNIINEAIQKVINERNDLRNVGNINVNDECFKAQDHIKAAINIWKKVGQYDSGRGQAGSWWSTAMKYLTQAKNVVERYAWEGVEASENDSEPSLTNAEIGKTMQSKPLSYDKIKKQF